jgi:acyl carrier protein
MTDIREIEDKVRDFILNAFLPEGAAATFGNDDDLLKILDSLQILRMVITFEGVFGIKIEDGDLSPENLGSVRKVAALVARKSGDARHPAPCGPRPGADVGDRPRTSGAVGG